MKHHVNDEQQLEEFYREHGVEGPADPDTHFYDPFGRPCTPDQWGAIHKHNAHRIARTTIGRVVVSTLSHGVNYNFTGIGAPITFETAVMVGKFDEPIQRYATREEALEGHAALVAVLEAK